MLHLIAAATLTWFSIFGSGEAVEPVCRSGQYLEYDPDHVLRTVVASRFRGVSCFLWFNAPH
ncbi:MAG: hypothetical protein QGF87_08690, partial [Woeseiaceae bacterium]|nr:hypothetical protein [Woeseiaceae bacterium]